MVLIIVMRTGAELMEFMKYSDVKPWKSMLGPFMQAKILSLKIFHHENFCLDAIFHFTFPWYTWLS